MTKKAEISITKTEHGYFIIVGIREDDAYEMIYFDVNEYEIKGPEEVKKHEKQS